MRYYGRGELRTDIKTDKYIHINNFGLFEDIAYKQNVIRPHGRSDYHLISLIKGKAKFIINSKVINAEEGTTVLYYPDEAQEYQVDVGSSTFWLHFTGKEIKSLLERLGFDKKVFIIENFEYVKTTFWKMMHSVSYNDEATEDMLNSLFISLLAHIRPQKKYIDSRIANVIKQINSENFNEGSIKKYAEISRLSEHHFIKIFKAHTGMTPNQYKAKILCEKAINLLAQNILNISEIADALGFEDSLYFGRFFKKHMGTSPKNYQTEHLK